MLSERSSSSTFYTEFVEMWKEISQKVDDGSINEKYAETSKLIGKYAELNNQIITIYNMKQQKVLYISETYHTVSGYTCTVEEYKKWSSVYWLRDLPMVQSWFMLQMSLWFKTSIQSKIKHFEGQKGLHFYLHNFKLRAPEADRTHHLSLVVDSLEIAPNGSPIIFLIVKKEIGSLIKEDGPWWGEFCINQQERYYFHEDEKKFQKGGILSEREREILGLVKTGHETKQIAEQLDISVHTVDKHRKNMLERTGAKDTTCLIQILEAGKIL
jgi:DNA-binding CsgD family transcriptional regulator